MADDPKCGFCHRGTEVSSICGNLYQRNKCIAHVRCMQYSACLIQYNTKIGLGGFKTDKVKDEITRGSKLRCAICIKKKEKEFVKGASSGCAIGRCHKTFHYFCAAKDKGSVTRRMEVLDKHKGSTKPMVEYRVFCSQKHYDAYLTAKEKGGEHVRDPAEESGTDDDDNPAGKTLPISDSGDTDIETDSSSSSSSRPTTSEDESNNKSKKRSVKKPEQKSPKRRLSRSSPKKAKKVKTAVIDSSDSEDDFQDNGQISENNNIEDYEDEIENGVKDNGKTIGTLTPVGSKNTANEDSTVANSNARKSLKFQSSTPKADSEDSKEAGPSSSLNKNGLANFNSKMDGLLCFVELLDVKPDLETKLKKFAAKTFKILPGSLCICTFPQFNLTEKHIVYLLKDIITALRQKDYEEFQRLVLHLKMEDIGRYDYVIGVNKGYPRDLTESIYHKLRNSIREGLVDVSTELQQKIGLYCRVQHNQQQIRIALIALTDTIDPNSRIRRTRFKHQDAIIYQWDNTTVCKRNPKATAESRLSESETLQEWLRSMEGAIVDSRPQEVELIGDQSGSVTALLYHQFLGLNTSGLGDGCVLFVQPVDSSVLKFRSYLKKVLNGLKDRGPEDCVSYIVVFDLTDDLREWKQISDCVPNHFNLSMYSAFSPDEQPVTSIILLLELQVQPMAAADDMPMVTSYLEGQEPEEDEESGEVILVGEERPAAPLTFTPTDYKWKLLQTLRLELSIKSIGDSLNAVKPKPLGFPVKRLQIKGDGNCFFRAISLEVTGSQNQHYQVRRRLINHMTKNHKLFTKYFSMRSIEYYLSKSRMADDAVWATETEVISMATLLETDIVIYTKAGGKYSWLPYSPIGGTRGHNCQVYLCNKGNHFDVVADVA